MYMYSMDMYVWNSIKYDTYFIICSLFATICAIGKKHISKAVTPSLDLYLQLKYTCSENLLFKVSILSKEWTLYLSIQEWRVLALPILKFRNRELMNNSQFLNWREECSVCTGIIPGRFYSWPGKQRIIEYQIYCKSVCNLIMVLTFENPNHL